GSIARAAQAATPRFGWIEALDESVLIADQGGAPVAANTSYRELISLALIGSQAEGAPVTVDRLFGANPGLAAPVYRLSKGAKAGHARREILPPITIGPERVPAQFEITVSPLPRDKVLWRIRPIAGEREATGAADLK
ncbi:MAG TPA: hybrid sensor histidine kinase/response regulator, partial [Hyphomonas sp.]|nr:hybrid sensor histidine kinase/response regulator [Hyphomonas sp.]